MQSEGIAQLESWKREGVFATYNALFTTYAADSVPDMFLMLRFNHFTDLGRWQKIEETYPGGLTEKAQARSSRRYVGHSGHCQRRIQRTGDEAVTVFCP